MRNRLTRARAGRTCASEQAFELLCRTQDSIIVIDSSRAHPHTEEPLRKPATTFIQSLPRTHPHATGDLRSVTNGIATELDVSPHALCLFPFVRRRCDAVSNRRPDVIAVDALSGIQSVIFPASAIPSVLSLSCGREGARGLNIALGLPMDYTATRPSLVLASSLSGGSREQRSACAHTRREDTASARAYAYETLTQEQQYLRHIAMRLRRRSQN